MAQCMVSGVAILFAYQLSYGRCASTFYSKNLCGLEGVAECSFQLPGNTKEKSCYVYNTSVCRHFDFGTWFSREKSFPIKEEFARFSFSVLPYPGKYDNHQYFIESGINVTFTSKTKDINGFVLEFPNYRNMCRVFDYRNASYQNRQGVSLFYDCIYLSREVSYQSFLMRARALPINEELEYEVYVPSGKEMNPKTLCEWKPLIMIFITGLNENAMEMKFSRVPPQFNVTTYHVSLHQQVSDGVSAVVHTTCVTDQPERKMLHVDFVDISNGYYQIGIQYGDGTDVCREVITGVFHIKKWRYDQIIAFYVACILILVIAIAVTIFMCFRQGMKAEFFSPKILFVYSYDFREHGDAVLQLQSFLTDAGCQVYSIYGNGDPDKWLSRMYSQADVIIIIISIGVFHKIENGNHPYPMMEKHKWGDRLIPAITLLQKEVLKTNFEKKVMKVFFEYSGHQDLPSGMELKIWGDEFFVPKQLKSFFRTICTKRPQHCLLCQLAVQLFQGKFPVPDTKSLKTYIQKAKVEHHKRVSEQQNDENYVASAFTESNTMMEDLAEDLSGRILEPVIFQEDLKLDGADYVCENLIFTGGVVNRESDFDDYKAQKSKIMTRGQKIRQGVVDLEEGYSQGEREIFLHIFSEDSQMDRADDIREIPVFDDDVNDDPNSNFIDYKSENTDEPRIGIEKKNIGQDSIDMNTLKEKELFLNIFSNFGTKENAQKENI